MHADRSPEDSELSPSSDAKVHTAQKSRKRSHPLWLFPIFALLAICSAGGVFFTNVPLFSSNKNPDTKNSPDSPIHVDSREVDLGSIEEGRSKTGRIVISNISRYPVLIKQVSTTCGCTSAKVTEDAVPSGGKTILEAELTPEGRRGRFGSKVTLQWEEAGPNGRQQGKTEVAFYATALYLAAASPTELDFGRLAYKATPVTRTVEIRRGTQLSSFVDINAGSDAKGVSAAITKENADKWLIKVTLSTEQFAQGPATSTVAVSFRDEKGGEIAQRELPIRADITGPVSAKPKTLFLGTIEAGKSKEGYVNFEAAWGQSPLIKDIRIEPDTGSIVFTKAPPSPSQSSTASLKYAVTTSDKHGNESGRLFVDFQDESLGTICVPFIFYVRDPMNPQSPPTDGLKTSAIQGSAQR